jgi:hypothetical protein
LLVTTLLRGDETMKTPILLLAALALQTGVAVAADGMASTRVSNPVVCRWRATQQSGIPVQICLSRRQWEQRIAQTQQAIREFQARSFVKK